MNKSAIILEKFFRKNPKQDHPVKNIRPVPFVPLWQYFCPFLHNLCPFRSFPALCRPDYPLFIGNITYFYSRDLFNLVAFFIYYSSSILYAYI